MKTISTIFKISIKSNLIIIFLFLLLAGLTSCSKDDGAAAKEIVKSSEKELISFSFLAINNETLSTDATPNINVTTKTIIANLPSDTPLAALTPTFSISQKASITPQGAQDFTSPITYIVTAEDGTINNYTVTAISNSSAKQITSFVFLLTNNPIDITVVATIDEENKTITAALPSGTSLSGLLPEVKISEYSTIDINTEQDFTNPIAYTVTAEDGSEVIYTVTITALLGQLQILQAILDANPQNTLGWDLNTTTNFGDLDGVTLNAEDEIIKLRIIDKTISTLPPEIGQLNILSSLLLNGNQLTALPVEIGQLINLTALNLRANEFTSFPSEIIQLINLTELSFRQNQLTTLAPEIGQLTNLTSLDLLDNELTTIPPEIGQLINLTSLIIHANQLTSLPSEIGQMTNLAELSLKNNQLTSLPTELGQLINLTNLDLSLNQLTALPTEIGQLSNLKSLNLFLNQLTSLPNEIGQLTNLTELSLRSTQLTSLPPELRQLTNLTELSLRGNQLTSLAPEIGQLINLISLDLRSNPLESIPQEVCDLQTSNGGILTILTDPGEGCN